MDGPAAKQRTSAWPPEWIGEKARQLDCSQVQMCLHVFPHGTTVHKATKSVKIRPFLLVPDKMVLLVQLSLAHIHSLSGLAANGLV
jgi:hypothetical protein